MSKKLSMSEVKLRVFRKHPKALDSTAHVGVDGSLKRREFLAAIAGTALFTIVDPSEAFAAVADESVNLAKVAGAPVCIRLVTLRCRR
jgi:hypothetical protein